MRFKGWYLCLPIYLGYGPDLKPDIVSRAVLLSPVLALLVLAFDRLSLRHPIWITGEL